MAERGRRRKKTIAETREAGKKAEVLKYKKKEAASKGLYKMRVSCFGCEIFENKSPNDRVSMFRPDFALLHNDHENTYAEHITLIEEYLSGENHDEKSWDDLQLCGKCWKCRDLLRNSVSELNELHKKELFKLFKPFATIVGKRNAKKLHNAQEKLFDIGAWPLKRLVSSGIDQRPYWNEKFVNLLSEEEVKLLLLFDYNMEREIKSHNLDLVVNLELPLNNLVDSFKNIVKERKAALYKELYGDDGRLNLPDFEKWNVNILAYTLKEKGVKASLLNPEWPNKKLSRKEVADLLFPGEEDKLQKLDRYIREAKKLIDQAIAFEGPFKMYGLSTFFVSHYWQQLALSQGTLYRFFPFSSMGQI